MQKKCVVLYSGGIDSLTCLAIAKSEGYACHVVSFDYDQRHRGELKVAQAAVKAFGVAEHRIVKLPMGAFGGSALTDSKIDVPDFGGASADIPVTYVPGRNTVFLAVAMSFAESIGATDIFIGVNALDYAGYPDCRPEYIAAFEKVANLGTKLGLETGAYKFHTPLISLTKAQIIEKGSRLGVDYAASSSCYQVTEDGRACGRCDSCTLRAEGFKTAGLPDPTRYVS